MFSCLGRRQLQRAVDDKSGVTAVEFAFVAPPLLLLILGVIEIGLLTLAASTLEAANNVTSRTGATGYAGAGLTREETIRAAIENSAAPFLDPAQVSISTMTYATFDQIGQPEPWNDVDADGIPDPGEFTDINGNGSYDTDMGVVGAGGGGSVVVYTVSYPWHLMTPIVGQFFGNNGVVTIASRSVVKNEPF